MLTETTPELLDALSSALALHFGTDPLMVEATNTGGGVMVCRIDISQDGRWMGRQLWLTRDGAGDDWILGFYDFAANEEDEGVCVQLLAGSHSDDPFYVAGQVAAILSRLGVTLQ